MTNPPIRIQRKRTKGWRMPENTVCVSRPSPYGNPFDWRKSDNPRDVASAKAEAVAMYSRWLKGWIDNVLFGMPPTNEDILRDLRGKNLACWCPLDAPCHADVLLELANQ